MYALLMYMQLKIRQRIILSMRFKTQLSKCFTNKYSEQDMFALFTRCGRQTSRRAGVQQTALANSVAQSCISSVADIVAVIADVVVVVRFILFLFQFVVFVVFLLFVKKKKTMLKNTSSS